MNAYGSVETEETQPTRTTREGVFAAGAFREPKDIPETVAEAAGAAAEVAAFLQGTVKTDTLSSTGTLAGTGTLSGTGGQKAVPGRAQADEHRDVSDEEPKVGVFVCECNGDLAPVGVAEVVEWAAGCPGVAAA